MTLYPGLDLDPQHANLIAASAISREVAGARGYRTVRMRSELAALGFKDYQQRIPGLLVPVRDVFGLVALHQYRPDSPRVREGKPVKYETPAKARMVLDVPAPICQRLRNASELLIITEGARKADAAVSAGKVAISLMGVWNWRGTNSLGGKTMLEDWDAIALNGRNIVLVFDSDVWTKTSVYEALERLKRLLERRGARVRVARLDSKPKSHLDG